MQEREYNRSYRSFLQRLTQYVFQVARTKVRRAIAVIDLVGCVRRSQHKSIRWPVDLSLICSEKYDRYEPLNEMV